MKNATWIALLWLTLGLWSGSDYYDCRKDRDRWPTFGQIIFTISLGPFWYVAGKDCAIEPVGIPA